MPLQMQSRQSCSVVGLPVGRRLAPYRRVAANPKQGTLPRSSCMLGLLAAMKTTIRRMLGSQETRRATKEITPWLLIRIPAIQPRTLRLRKRVQKRVSRKQGASACSSKDGCARSSKVMKNILGVRPTKQAQVFPGYLRWWATARRPRSIREN